MLLNLIFRFFLLRKNSGWFEFEMKAIISFKLAPSCVEMQRAKWQASECFIDRPLSLRQLLVECSTAVASRSTSTFTKIKKKKELFNESNTFSRWTWFKKTLELNANFSNIFITHKSSVSTSYEHLPCWYTLFLDPHM